MLLKGAPDYKFTKDTPYFAMAIEYFGECIIMMTSSNGNIFRITGHLCGKFTGPRWISHTRPVTRSFDVFFDMHPNKRLSKQWWDWWFETPPCPLWRHRNYKDRLYYLTDVLCITTRILSYHSYFKIVSSHKQCMRLIQWLYKRYRPD